MAGAVDDTSTCRYNLPCDHQEWLHERLQRTVPVCKSQPMLHDASDNLYFDINFKALGYIDLKIWG